MNRSARARVGGLLRMSLSAEKFCRVLLNHSHGMSPPHRILFLLRVTANIGPRYYEGSNRPTWRCDVTEYFELVHRMFVPPLCS